MSKSKSGGKSLPKFGEWDVNNPSSGEGFTVIFNTARDEKKNERNNSTEPSPSPNNQDKSGDKCTSKHQCPSKKWLSCFRGK